MNFFETSAPSLSGQTYIHTQCNDLDVRCPPKALTMQEGLEVK